MDDRSAVEFLKEILSIYSPSGEEGELAAFLAERLHDLGFYAEVDPVGNVIAANGEVSGKDSPLRPDLLLLGHIDTVPGLIPVREEGGKLYGRGAVDAKGPLAAFVAALSRSRDRLAKTRVVLVGAVGEEADSRGARHILPRFLPRAAIVGEPSGWEGIVLGYKGRMSASYVVSTPLRHPAAPGPTAAEEALELWRRLRLFVRRKNRGRKGLFDVLDMHLRGFNTSCDGFAERAELVLEFRLPPWLDPGTLRREVEALKGMGNIRCSGGEPAFLAPKGTTLVRRFLRAIRKHGGKPVFRLKTGTSDMNLVGPAWGCPVVAYGPGDSRLDHAPNEHIGIEEFLKGVGVLTQVLGKWIPSAHEGRTRG